MRLSSRKNKFFPILLPLAVCLALFLGGCRGTAPAQADAVSSAAEEEAEQLQQGRFYIAVSPDGFNPYLSSSTLVQQSGDLLFEKLVELTPDMELDYRDRKSVV